MDYLIDTTFLIHAWRSAVDSKIRARMEPFMDAALGVPWVVRGEYLRGTFLADQDVDEAENFLNNFTDVWPDKETVRVYSKLFSDLKRRNQLLGPHDMWIAASSLRHDYPLLTDNVKEFSRVPGLRIENYVK